MDTIGSYLAHDHAQHDALFAHACVEVRAGMWDAASATVAALNAALLRHLHREEAIVFAAFDAIVKHDCSPTLALCREHRAVQGMLLRLKDAVVLRDASAFFKHAATVRVLMQHHHEKEETGFYPVAERILAGQREALIAAMRRADAIETLPEGVD